MKKLSDQTFNDIADIAVWIAIIVGMYFIGVAI